MTSRSSPASICGSWHFSRSEGGQKGNLRIAGSPEVKKIWVGVLERGFGVGPFRWSLSKGGIGYSWGFPGFRIGRAATGCRYVSIGIPGTGPGEELPLVEVEKPAMTGDELLADVDRHPWGMDACGLVLPRKRFRGRPSRS